MGDKKALDQIKNRWKQREFGDSSDVTDVWWLIGKVEHLGSEVERLREAKELIEIQAEDDGLWFVAETAPEAYLQESLRRLHEVIEGVSQEECARRALEPTPQPPPNQPSYETLTKKFMCRGVGTEGGRDE